MDKIIIKDNINIKHKSPAINGILEKNVYDIAIMFNEEFKKIYSEYNFVNDDTFALTFVRCMKIFRAKSFFYKIKVFSIFFYFLIIKMWGIIK